MQHKAFLDHRQTCRHAGAVNLTAGNPREGSITAAETTCLADTCPSAIGAAQRATRPDISVYTPRSRDRAEDYLPRYQ